MGAYPRSPDRMRGELTKSGNLAALPGFQRLCRQEIGRTSSIPEISGIRPGDVHRISSAGSLSSGSRHHARIGKFRSSAITAFTKVGLFAAWDGPSTAAAPQAATLSGASPWGRHADFWLSWRARKAGFRWGDSCVKHYYRIPQGDPNKYGTSHRLEGSPFLVTQG